MLQPFKVLSEKSVYDFQNRFSVIEVDLETPESKKVTWNYIASKDVVVILPFDEKGRVYLKQEWRLNRKDFLWELPGGFVEEQNPSEEQILDAANRELQEEIGMKSNHLEKVAVMYPSNYLNTKFHLFFATDLVVSELLPDEHEHLEVKTLPLEEAYELVINKQIPVASNMILFLLAKQRSSAL